MRQRAFRSTSGLTKSKLAHERTRAGATQSEGNGLSQFLIARRPGIKVVDPDDVYAAISQLRDAVEVLASAVNDRVVTVPSLRPLTKGPNSAKDDPIGSLWPDDE